MKHKPQITVTRHAVAVVLYRLLVAQDNVTQAVRRKSTTPEERQRAFAILAERQKAGIELIQRIMAEPSYEPKIENMPGAQAELDAAQRDG